MVFRSFLILRARHEIAFLTLQKPQNVDVTKRTNRLVKQKQIKPQKTFLIISTSRRLALLSPSRARARIIYKVFSLSANNHSFVCRMRKTIFPTKIIRDGFAIHEIRFYQQLA